MRVTTVDGLRNLARKPPGMYKNPVEILDLYQLVIAGFFSIKSMI